MKELRLISFLPAATEMACALGLEAQLVGISHECDYPPTVRGKPVVVRCELPVEQMSLKEIDAAVAERIGSGGQLYEVDTAMVERLAPTHILTQALCQVCAPSGADLAETLRALPSRPELLWFSPHCIEDIFENLRELGRATGRLERAEGAIVAGRARLQEIAEVVKWAPAHPRVLCLEWIEPYYGCGHWVPEMIELAGGQEGLGRKGADSVRISWTDIAAGLPEVLIVSPCGFGLEQATEQARELLRQPGWSELPAVRNHRVFAVNANAYFARPGPRVVEGTELLAHLLHPERCRWSGPAGAFRHIKATEVGPMPVRVKVCPECGAEFTCGAKARGKGCWCEELPPLPRSPLPGAECLCPVCLRKAVERTVQGVKTPYS